MSQRLEEAIETINIRNIAEEQGLIDDITIINEQNKLERILTAFTNFCHEPKEKPKDDESKFRVSSEFESLAEKVVSYAIDIINNYEKLNPFKLLFATFETLEFLPRKDKENYIDHFKGFIEKEAQYKNSYCVIPLIINNVLNKLNAKYYLLFNGLSKDEIKSNSLKYQSHVSKLKKDLQKVVEYTSEKLCKNRSFDLRAQNISYEECFPNNEIDFSKLTPEYIIGLIESREVPQKLIEEFGMPIGMDMKGKRELDLTTFIVYHGDPSKPQATRVNNNISDRDVIRFYLGLSSQITHPIPALAESTRKVRGSLASRQH